MKSLLLIGGGGHCRSCVDVIESDKNYDIAGVVDRESMTDCSVFQYPLLGCDDDLPDLLDIHRNALVTLGHINDAAHRIRLFHRLQELGAELPVIVSSFAHVSRYADIQQGTIVMHFGLVNAGVKIGENCIINSQSLVEHDVTIGAHCHISTGARINGGVTIGPGCFVGSGAVIRENVSIGSNSVIGAGTVVLKDLPSDSRYRGLR